MNKLTLISALMLALASAKLAAQELPRPSLARHEDSPTSLPSDYNMKMGPILINLNASLSGEFVDNIALTHNGAKSDFILTPQAGIQALWPVTKTNTLSFTTSIGYAKYLIHPQYDSGQLLIAPDSALSFNVYVGDFKINLHDQFSFQQDPGLIGSLSNVVTFNRIQNTAGLGVTWDLNQLQLFLGYDHINFYSDLLQTVSGDNLSNPGNLNYQAEQISASATYKFTSTVSGGLESTVSIRNYDHFSIQDNQVSVGPFVRMQISHNLSISASGGFQSVSTDSGTLDPSTLAANTAAPAAGAGTNNSYYADLTLDHRLNRYYSDRLSVGHDVEVDAFSQQSDVTYASYTSSYRANEYLNLALTMNFQDVHGSSGTINTGSFDLFSTALQANFPVTKRISGAVVYQFSDKFNATSTDDSYEQNSVGMILNYHF